MVSGAPDCRLDLLYPCPLGVMALQPHGSRRSAGSALGVQVSWTWVFQHQLLG